MRQYVSVDKAIWKGHFMVNAPVLLSLFGIPALSFYLKYQGLIPVWGIFVAFLIGFVLAWLIWSFMITKWRIWAFNNVRNVHELKKRAIEEKLIWGDHSKFEKTEIRSKYQKEKIDKLKHKFEKEDIYKEDYSLPLKTAIYFSKTTIIFQLVISIFLLIVGIYFIFFSKEKYQIWAFLAVIFGAYYTFKNLKKSLDRKPHISIDRQGITSRVYGFAPWAEIMDEEIIYEPDGKNTIPFLFYYIGEDVYEKIKIDELNVSQKKLKNILRTYRIRYTKNM
ncbi:hypothetical protein [Dokdonia sp.]|uniref:hypothetical protein n=1 Tax=Dokdonia sp. TaxID=2024995 RepID=UPI003264984F